MRAVEMHLLPEEGAFPGIDRALLELSGVEREALTNLGWHSDGSYTLLYRLRGEEAALQSAFADASKKISIDVEWTGGYAPEQAPVLGRLTDRQREALTAAYEMGYYEEPREISFGDVADELDIAPSTANELLRRAEAVLVDAVITE